MIRNLKKYRTYIIKCDNEKILRIKVKGDEVILDMCSEKFSYSWRRVMKNIK